MNRLLQLAGVRIINEATDNVMIIVESEEGTQVLSFDRKTVERIKQLLLSSEEWPDEVNQLLDQGTPADITGTVNTMGDGWGWYGSD